MIETAKIIPDDVVAAALSDPQGEHLDDGGIKSLLLELGPRRYGSRITLVVVEQQLVTPDE